MNNTITIDIWGLDDLAKVSEKLAGFDTTHILDEGAAILFNRVRTRFLQQVDPDGLPWPESKAAEYRAKIGRGGGTLYASGRLFHSLQLHPETAPDGSMGRAISTDVPYGKFHMTGTIHMPPRVFLGFNEEDTEIMVSRVASGLNDLLEK